MIFPFISSVNCEEVKLATIEMTLGTQDEFNSAVSKEMARPGYDAKMEENYNLCSNQSDRERIMARMKSLFVKPKDQ